MLQALERAPRWSIKKLTSTYLTLHLSDIAHTIGIENVDEVRALILDMVSVLYKDVSRGGPLFMSDVVLDCILGNICATVRGWNGLVFRPACHVQQGGRGQGARTGSATSRVVGQSGEGDGAKQRVFDKGTYHRCVVSVVGCGFFHEISSFIPFLVRLFHDCTDVPRVGCQRQGRRILGCRGRRHDGSVGSGCGLG